MIHLFQGSTHLRNTMGRFVRNRDGNVSLMFGIALLPMMAAMGAAMDYSRASDARTQLQNAIDSTVLAVASRAPGLSDSQLSREAAAYFQGVMQNRHDLASLPIVVTRTDKRFSVAASGVLPTTFMKLFGVTELTIGSKAEAAITQRKVELALVLDNTGSMGRLSKMDELKKATKNLIANAEAASPAGSDYIKIAIVPFATQVRVEQARYRNQTWLAFKDYPIASDAAFDDIRNTVMASYAGWDGCITDRGPDYDTNDKRSEMARPQSLHPAVACATSSLARIQPLTNNWNALRNTTDAMRPEGNTNITIGARFGIAALSPDEPIGGGAAFGKSDVDKYMIVLTDGDNTENRFGRGSASIDAKTRAMCNEIKAKPMRTDASGRSVPAVNIFTVRVIEGNRALLQNCATNATMFKDVSQASDIDAVFKGIINEITSLKLTS